MKTPKKRVPTKRRTASQSVVVLELRLYIADTSARSVLAKANLQSLCQKYLRGRCRVTVIDLVKEPDLARRDEILAIPTLVRVFPGPSRMVIGCLSDKDRVLKALELDRLPDEVESLPALGISPLGSA
jgi:circadian clock protein KaiB